MKLVSLFFGLFFILQAHSQSLQIHALEFEDVKETKDFFQYTGNDAPIISGHRGGAAKDYPENTIATFEHVLTSTPAIFEVDVRLTKDNKVVLLHDETLDRTTTGSGNLNEFSLGEVKDLKLIDTEGNVTDYLVPTLEEAIKWSNGKTLLNLDVKDVPVKTKAEIVKGLDAFHHVIFTVHTAQEAKSFYEIDNRSLFSAFIKTEEALRSYEDAGIPWENIAIAYVGSTSSPENKNLYALLHDRGVMVMVSAAPTYDKLDSPQERAKAYRAILEDGADIIESDRPIEVASAIKSMFPKENTKRDYWKTRTIHSLTGHEK